MWLRTERANKVLSDKYTEKEATMVTQIPCKSMHFKLDKTNVTIVENLVILHMNADYHCVINKDKEEAEIKEIKKTSAGREMEEIVGEVFRTQEMQIKPLMLEL
jgi:hypothetical protein